MHGPDAAIVAIRKHRQAFCHGVFSANTMLDYGIEDGFPMDPLSTKIEQEPVYVGFYLPRLKMNYQLYRATVSRLGMQLVVAVGDAFRTHVAPDWTSHPRGEVQFLRQIRNAAAHDNHLRFESNDDPRDDTCWNGFEITAEMEGMQVFPDFQEMIVYDETVEMSDGFMEAGDALALTSDILMLLVGWSNTYEPEDVRGSIHSSTQDENI